MNNIKEKYKQAKNIEFTLNNHGCELWVQVAGNTKLNGAKAGFWSALIPLNNIDTCLSHSSWESRIGTTSPGYVKYGNDDIMYDKFSGHDYEPLVNYREFNGILPDYIEIVEEFRLINNLYYDIENWKFLFIKENGTTDEVAKIEGDCVYIKLNYLMRYANAKQMAIALFFDIRFNIDGALDDYNLEAFSDKIKTQDYYAEIWGDEMNIGTKSVYSVLMGKKLLLPQDVEKCGYWPYDEEQKIYEDFITGINKDGTEKFYTSNPGCLSNYFGANPDAPHYLTPIFFKREVLQKYLSHPELYSVEDGYLRCGLLWGMAIDNHQKEYISAYLGDLGRDLPQEEQKYWKSYNILIDGKLSSVKFKRDFCAMFAETEISDLKFKMTYLDFIKLWGKHNSWEFFLPLSKEDKYNFDQLHLPITHSQEEFDHLVLSLVKTIIDSLNEKQILAMLKDKNNLNGGISKLERWFEESELENYELHIKFLRNLQELRSSGTGHRKGSSYNKISKIFHLDIKSFNDVFDEILINAISFILYLKEELIEKKECSNK